MTLGKGPSRVLSDLAVTALLGTDRVTRVGAGPATLLAQAAVAGVRARAGRQCRVAVQAVEACPVEARAEANASQGAILERLLDSPEAALIDEWCTLAQARGVRVPAFAVPTLLDWWARQPVRSAEVFAATGACGVWLAGLNQDWQRPVVTTDIPADAEAVWQTGKAAERGALLLSVRRAEPARALAMVRATWDADGADERRRFIEVLAHGVSTADEAFLEAALDDRSKTVRREAARVLTRLPGSTLRARMRERAASMIVVERTRSGVLRRSKVTVKIEPPKDFDKAWERDGVDEQPATGKGKRAFWMVQMLSAADLAVWTAASGLAPADLLESIAEDEYFGDAFGSMLASLAACPDQPDAAAWGDAILAASKDGKAAGRKFVNEPNWASMWREQPVDRSEAMRLAFVAGNQAAKGLVAWRVLTSDSRAWSLAFSTSAMQVFRDTMPKKTETWDFWSPVDTVSRLLHPGASEQFEQLIAAMYPDGPSESIRKSLERVRLRAEMHKEFGS